MTEETGQNPEVLQDFPAVNAGVDPQPDFRPAVLPQPESQGMRQIAGERLPVRAGADGVGSRMAT